MTIYKIEDLTVSELKERLEDKIKSLRELEMKIEEMYRIGAYDHADHLDMISGVMIENIMEIEDLLIERKGINHEKSN